MKKSSDMRTVLARSGTPEAVPIWELEFHIWDKFAETPVLFGGEFAELSPSGQERMIRTNAEAILSVARRLHFSAVTIPGGYWEVAKDQPAYYWLPDSARFSLAEILAKEKPDSLLLVANIGGVLAMPDGDRFVEFSLRLLEDPDSIDREAEQCLVSGLEQAVRIIVRNHIRLRIEDKGSAIDDLRISDSKEHFEFRNADFGKNVTFLNPQSAIRNPK